jgi:hypothetical protein
MPLSHDELGAISREVAFCGEAVGKDIRELPIVARKLLPFWASCVQPRLIVFVLDLQVLLSPTLSTDKINQRLGALVVAATPNSTSLRFYPHLELFAPGA